MFADFVRIVATTAVASRESSVLANSDKNHTSSSEQRQHETCVLATIIELLAMSGTAKLTAEDEETHANCNVRHCKTIIRIGLNSLCVCVCVSLRFSCWFGRHVASRKADSKQPAPQSDPSLSCVGV